MWRSATGPPANRAEGRWYGSCRGRSREQRHDVWIDMPSWTSGRTGRLPKPKPPKLPKPPKPKP
jgi:hypothetical protein